MEESQQSAGAKWTEREDMTLSVMFWHHYDDVSIAKQLKRTPGAVVSRRRHLGLSRRELNEQWEPSWMH